MLTAPRNQIFAYKHTSKPSLITIFVPYFGIRTQGNFVAFGAYKLKSCTLCRSGIFFVKPL